MASNLDSQLHESVSQDFRNLVDTMSCPLMVYAQGRALYANDAWLSLMSMTLQELLRMENVHSFYQQADDADVFDNGNDVTRGRLHSPGGQCFDASHQPIIWKGRDACLLLVSSTRAASIASASDHRNLLDFSRNTRDWFWEMDSEFRFSWFSDNIESVTGYSPQSLKGRKRSEFADLSEQERHDWDANMAQMQRHEPFLDFVFRTANKDGRTLWIRTSGAPFFDAAGAFCGYRGTGSDITDTRLLEIALRNSERRFREYAETASDWFWEMDEDLRFTYISEKVADPIGKSASYFMGKTRFEIFGDDLLDDPKWADHYALLERRESFRDFVYCSPDSDGILPGWLRVSGSPVYSVSGEFKGYRGCTSMITEQVQAEIARSKSEERFREFSEIAADWFWELDADLYFNYVSDRFQEICGVSSKRLIGLYAGDLEKGYSDYQVWGDRRADSIVEMFKRQQPFEGWQFNWQHPDGRVLRISCNARPIFDDAGQCTGYRGIASDVTHEYQLSKELEFRANHDVLTGLCNRVEFDRHVQNAVDRANKRAMQSALLYIDLDQFKVVNDSVGHLAGDELLKRVANLISTQVRKGDIVARLGGDEFGVLLNDCTTADAQSIAVLIAEIIREFTFTWEEQAFRVSTSIGLVAITESCDSVTEVMSQADIACYAAKDAGRNRISRYEEHDEAVRRQRSQILQAAGIQDSLDNGRFRLFKQVILPITDQSEALRFELLLRLLDDNDQIISPGAVIPAAERFGLMPSIDRWVLKTAFKNLAFLQSMHADCVISVNLSGTTICDPQLPGYIEKLLATYQVACGSVCFEVTETALISNLKTAGSVIKSVKEMGHCFALDDFGSGMSSFAYLKHLPVDYLKIDGSFVKDMHHDETDYAVVAAINEVAHRVGIKTIAEFVENETIVEKLREVGVDYGQGYALGMPVPLDNVNDAIAMDPMAKGDCIANSPGAIVRFK